MARVIVFAADLDETIARTRPRRAGLRWGMVGDAETLLAIGLRETQLRGCFDRGNRLVVAEQDGRIVGYNIYLTASPLRQHTWLLINLQTGRDYLSMGGFVVPEKRGQRLLGDMKGFAARYFLAEGYRRNISVVHSDNRASLRSHSAVGAIPLTTLRHARIGKLRLVAQDGGIPRVMWGNKQPFVVTV
jgi:hypothetical protein